MHDTDSVVRKKKKHTAILAVVEENGHAVGVHGLSSVKLPVLEVGNNLLGKGRGTSLKRLDFLIRGAVGLHRLLDLLHVLLEVTKVRLLVERRLVEAERVDNVDDGCGSIVGTLISSAILSRGVGTNVCTREGSVLRAKLRELRSLRSIPMLSTPTVIREQSAS
jgi:hypothetical protein